jgi:hypothetical protein
MQDLDWKRILKLQCLDGSIMACPASTAYALMQTGDKKCLQYLDRIIKRFNGGGKECSACTFVLKSVLIIRFDKFI